MKYKKEMTFTRWSSLVCKSGRISSNLSKIAHELKMNLPESDINLTVFTNNRQRRSLSLWRRAARALP